MTPLRTLLLGGLLAWAVAPLSAAKFSGLIALEECAENGKVTEAEHAKCAEGKDRDDHVLVFVHNGDKKKVYELLIEDPADPFVGKWVTIEGELEDNFLDIRSIAAAPEPKGKK